MSEFSRLRTSAGISVDALADLAGFSRSTVYRWERGQTRPRRAAVKLLDTMIRDSRAAKPQGKPPGKNFRFIDLFAGIGGLRRGFDEY
ncbi:helix-turn-helix domain-containing protein, partial [Escherichia coli]|nr:helix-turn-helix domain-containing protein [Escherichia coli]